MGPIRKFDYHRLEPPKEGLESLFATPLWRQALPIATPDFLARVRAYVMALKSKDIGVKRSNYGGWHSSGDLFATSDETITALADALLAAVGQMAYFQVKDHRPHCSIEVAFASDAWANVSGVGDFNKPHTHPGVMWSGVFYVDPGECDPKPADNGKIEFIDPRPGTMNLTKRKIRPVAGQLLIFPAWLMHYVNPFRGRGERISIAFNANARLAAQASAPAVQE